MKKAIVISCLLLMIIGIIGAGAYYWEWNTLHHAGVISEPANSLMSANDKKDQTQKANSQVNILVLGTDNRGNEVARSDLLMFVTANVDTHHVAMISIPRDTRVNLPNVGLTKINHANAVGEEQGGVREGTLESVKAVSNLLGVPINYYVKIDFQGFKKAVDAVGGIEVNLPNAVNDDLRGIHLSAGINHLSGDQALRLSRARYGLPNGDFDRQCNQFYLLSTLANTMLNLSNISKLSETIHIVYQDLIDTNMSAAEMAAMGLNFKGITENEIQYYQLPGKGISAQDPLVGAVVYYYEPDLNGVQKVVEQALANAQ
ncbi:MULTISPECIES: LCP family protein [unclassified Dehalobacter]|uniref:LCP family protein n=1 Tax=unclassified Dehalobacter TaxID=2635733 RepID=UPI00039D5DD1|nr:MULTISPECIES: LCP family protein [unclassified Dehalobacter]RJE48985.1 hypothetical protein A7K50_07675 [Dehalobacter sp. MCB1]TCX51723.1 LytR family transcriptional regulator [Dehalobacter sp. 14DCB1]TCX52783.1 LytR family transcriptional regulator [Dehalobacter sp. 12DCB1]